jgi:hypothetical protein
LIYRQAKPSRPELMIAKHPKRHGDLGNGNGTR